MINMNPQAPKLYGLIKNHKPGNPIRPVVSYINSPTRELSINLNSMFKQLTNFKPENNLNNSLDLVQKLNKKTPDNSILVSFDIKSMFSNIPTNECLILIDEILQKSNINPIIATEILSCFETCLSQTYFQFNNKFYLQHTGLPMGSPLSPLLADIFMSYIENKILNSNLGKNHIHFWYRYVDDVLACFKGTNRQLQNFLHYINSVHSKIQFTVEKEDNNEINFLDLTISHINNQCTFKVYRKPTFTGITIPNDSFHPIQHKLAAYNSMIHRALSLPLSEEELQKELCTIENIAQSNKFCKQTIKKLITKKQKRLAFQLIYPKINDQENNQKYASLSYCGTLSENIANTLSKHNIKVAFKSQNNISNIIHNPKDKTNKFDKSGVYKLKCSECDDFYIGQSGRSIKTRYLEHFRSYRLQKTDSTFANHCLEQKHKFPNLNNTEILHYSTKGQKLNYLESLEIYKGNKNNNVHLLNDQTELLFSPLFTVVKP